jgi:hypothetical protein
MAVCLDAAISPFHNARVDPSSSRVDEALSAPRATRRSQEHWILLAGSVGAFAIFIVLALWSHPDPRGFGTHEQLGLPACGMMAWTGIPCPGCGVTTSIALFAHGRFLESLRNQPLGFLVALAIPLCALWTIASHFLGRDLARDAALLRVKPFVIALFVVIAAPWIYKIALVKGWIG